MTKQLLFRPAFDCPREFDLIGIGQKGAGFCTSVTYKISPLFPCPFSSNNVLPISIGNLSKIISDDLGEMIQWPL